MIFILTGIVIIVISVAAFILFRVRNIDAEEQDERKHYGD